MPLLFLTLLSAAALGSAAVIPNPVTAAHSLGIADERNISVSGLSSGAFMATQMAVAFSGSIMGVGVVAGGPYWASNGNIALALSIMKNPSLVSVPELWAATAYARATHTIDDPANLARTRVFIWSGMKDTVARPALVAKVLEYYGRYVPDKNIVAVFNVSANHAWPTDRYGNACDYLGEPWINRCGRSGAGEILAHIYGPLRPRRRAPLSNVVKLDQATFLPLPWSRAAAGIDTFGYAYIPTGCRNSTVKCRLHIALHGCMDNHSYGGMSMVEHAGFNEWAEANDIIILYPQTLPTPVNPLGCWDWWGFTGLDFATKLAVQPVTIMRMVNSFVKTV